MAEVTMTTYVTKATDEAHPERETIASAALSLDSYNDNDNDNDDSIAEMKLEQQIR